MKQRKYLRSITYIVYFLTISFLLHNVMSEIFKGQHIVFTKIKVETIINIYFFLIFFIVFPGKIQVPSVKLFYILPNMRLKQAFSIFNSLFLNLKSSHLYVVTFFFLYLIKDYANGENLYLIFVAPFILLLIIANAWALKVSFRYFAIKEKLLSSFFTLLIIHFLTVLDLTHYFHWFSLVIAIIIFLKTLVNVLISNKFENLFLNTMTKNKKRKIIFKPNYFIKELRMIFRTKRLKFLFIVTPISSIIILIISLISQKPIENVFKYAALVMLSMNYNEYFNFFWTWDKQSMGGILSLPKAKKIFIKEKIYFAFLICMPVFIIHLIYFTFIDSFILSTDLILLVIFVSTYKSLYIMDKTNFLYLGLFAKTRTTAIFAITIIVGSLVNWYGILNQENDALKYLVVSVVFIISFYSRKYAYNYWENYEWSS